MATYTYNVGLVRECTEGPGTVRHVIAEAAATTPLSAFRAAADDVERRWTHVAPLIEVGEHLEISVKKA